MRLRSGALLAIVLTQATSCGTTTSQPNGDQSQSSLSPVVVTGAYALSGSNVPIDSPTPGFRYVVTLANQSAASEDVSYGGCWGFFQLYKTPDRTGTPAFDFENTKPGCEAFSTKVTLRPGEATQLSGSTGFSSLEGEGVAGGHYYSSVRVAPNGVQTTVPAGEVTVAP
jgi:hypothetical protein